MSRLLTWVLRLLPVLGLVLVVIGSQELYPETWLDSKGFVINLGSSLTAACFGIPLAFFVLQKLLRNRDFSGLRASFVRATLQIGEEMRSSVGAQEVKLRRAVLIAPNLAAALMRLARELETPDTEEIPIRTHPRFPPHRFITRTKEIEDCDFEFDPFDVAKFCDYLNEILGPVKGTVTPENLLAYKLAKYEWTRLIAEVAPLFVPFGFTPLPAPLQLAINEAFERSNPLDSLNLWLKDIEQASVEELGLSQNDVGFEHDELPDISEYYDRYEAGLDPPKRTLAGHERLAAAAKVRAVAGLVERLPSVSRELLLMLDRLELACSEATAIRLTPSGRDFDLSPARPEHQPDVSITLGILDEMWREGSRRYFLRSRS